MLNRGLKKLKIKMMINIYNFSKDQIYKIEKKDVMI